MSTAGSVAPPGWTPPPRAGSVAPPLVGVRALPGSIDRSRTPVPNVVAGPDAALRARMSAVILDSILANGLVVLAIAVLGFSYELSILAAVTISLGYFAFFELLRGGRTPGKRRYGLKVVMARDGGPPTTRAVILRAVLRPVDMFPMWYTSGIVSILRTGPERRQRLGDVLAGTVVVAAGDRALAERSPGWLLPVAALASLLVSACVVFGGIDRERSGPAGERAGFVADCTGSGAPAASCACIYDKVGRAELMKLDRAMREGDVPAMTEVRVRIAQTCGPG